MSAVNRKAAPSEAPLGRVDLRPPLAWCPAWSAWMRKPSLTLSVRPPVRRHRDFTDTTLTPMGHASWSGRLEEWAYGGDLAARAWGGPTFAGGPPAQHGAVAPLQSANLGDRNRPFSSRKPRGPHSVLAGGAGPHGCRLLPGYNAGGHIVCCQSAVSRLGADAVRSRSRARRDKRPGRGSPSFGVPSPSPVESWAAGDWPPRAAPTRWPLPAPATDAPEELSGKSGGRGWQAEPGWVESGGGEVVA